MVVVVGVVVVVVVSLLSFVFIVLHTLEYWNAKLLTVLLLIDTYVCVCVGYV